LNYTRAVPGPTMPGGALSSPRYRTGPSGTPTLSVSGGRRKACASVGGWQA